MERATMSPNATAIGWESSRKANGIFMQMRGRCFPSLSSVEPSSRVAIMAAVTPAFHPEETRPFVKLINPARAGGRRWHDGGCCGQVFPDGVVARRRNRRLNKNLIGKAGSAGGSREKSLDFNRPGVPPSLQAGCVRGCWGGKPLLRIAAASPPPHNQTGLVCGPRMHVSSMVAQILSELGHRREI